MDVIEALKRRMEEEEPSFSVIGLATSAGLVYPIGTDTKVLSTAFELIVRPLILQIARECGLQLHEPEAQNFYPDFTFMHNERDTEKIALDVKTTYRGFRRDGTWTAKFTLGSYTSFLRNETKNIAFPLSQYSKHYVLGFIYTRFGLTKEEQPFHASMVEGVASPVTDVEWFLQEKYRISSDSPGSGNTANIGSITGRSTAEFARGQGPFAELGEHTFEDYWRGYGTTAATRTYRNLSEYLRLNS